MIFRRMVFLGMQLSLLSLAASEYSPPPKEQAAAPLYGVISAAAKSGQKHVVWLTVFSSLQKVDLLKADDKGITVNVENNAFDQPWAKIAPDELVNISVACMDRNEASALAVIDYLLAYGKFEKADEVISLAVGFNPKFGEPLADRVNFLNHRQHKNQDAEKPSGSADATEGSAPARVVRWGNSVVDRSGRISHDAYVREALDWTPAAIHLRLGPDFDFYNKGKTKTVPTVYLPPEKKLKGARNGQSMDWTVGGVPAADSGDYSGTHAQLFYSPEKHGDPGVDRILVLEEGFTVFTYKPEKTWWGGTHPEPGVLTRAWAQSAGGNIGAPIAMARGYGLWCNSAVMIFSTGLVGTAGTCTSQNTYPFFQFPPNKVPTAIAITTRNEFALITIWDTEKMKGQVAVLVLDSTQKDSLMGLYSWHEPKPGLPNVGGFRSLKLLGYVDLPGMNAPSGICAYGTGWDQWLHSLDGKNVQPRELDTSNPKVRNTFSDKKEWNYHWISDAGFAAVISKQEDKVAFIDLQPLFAYVREMYFGSDENLKKTLDYGPGPKQWPFTFEVEPKQKPIVVAVQSTPAPTPTAVLCSVRGHDPSVLIGFQEGKLGIFKVGAKAADGPLNPAEIRCTGAVNVGRNPCCIAYNKNASWGKPETLNDTFIVVSRGDRSIQWVKVDNGHGEVIRTLTDSRLIDPVFCEMADTHGTESHVITVCDFKGRKVINYRFGPVIFHTNGGASYPMGPDGKDEFECGGFMEFPGNPYRVCGTNVN